MQGQIMKNSIDPLLFQERQQFISGCRRFYEEVKHVAIAGGIIRDHRKMNKPLFLKWF
jgi:hypothetical protein